MKNKILLIILIIQVSSIDTLLAAEERIINSAAPAGMEYLKSTLYTHKGIPLNKGAHGTKKYCYKKNIYIVYISNLLGHGYELSTKAPEKLVCMDTNKNLKGENKLGMYIGMSKNQAAHLLKLKNLKNNQPIIWLSTIRIDGKDYDLQTYVNIQFKNDVLEWLSVFTTTTS